MISNIKTEATQSQVYAPLLCYSWPISSNLYFYGKKELVGAKKVYHKFSLICNLQNK